MHKIYIDYKRNSEEYLKEILKEYHINYDIFYKEKELIFDDKAYIEMWTKKEAYSKYKGMGYAYGFKNIDTTKININSIYFLDYIISFYYDL